VAGPQASEADDARVDGAAWPKPFTRWLLPVEIPGRFLYGSRLGESLTVLSEWKTTRLIPDTAVPLEAAALCWHIEIGDFQIRWSGRGG
jgi:hypothetical protein